MSQSCALHRADPRRGVIRANLHAFIDRLPESKSWRVEVKELRKERSLDQNAALWGVAYPVLTDATGYTPDELHDALCRKFFGTVEREILGEVVMQPRRTTTTNERGDRDLIDTQKMAQFYQCAQQVGAELGIDVPDPDPLWHERDAA